jgi:hypothetical protein
MENIKICKKKYFKYNWTFYIFYKNQLQFNNYTIRYFKSVLNTQLKYSSTICSHNSVLLLWNGFYKCYTNDKFH